MKTLFKTFALGSLLLNFNANAALVSVDASADTTLTIHSGIPSPSGSLNQLFSIGFNFFNSYPLIKFDLSSYQNNIVQRDGILSLTYAGFFADPKQIIDVSTLKNNWDEATATYSNFNPFSNADVLQSSLSVDVSGFTIEVDKINFIIPKATIQDWILNPQTNYGLLLSPLNGRDIAFYSRESAFAPTLSFEVTAVPEPEAFAMMLIGLGLVGFSVRRK